MNLERRRRQWDSLSNHVYDVAVIGGGINGVSIYHQLCADGYSVALIDKGDFACGTSQASAMMVWGGLPYLRNGDLPTVRRLCTSRDRMLLEMSEWVSPRTFRFVTTRNPIRAAFARAAVEFYWLIGGCKRVRPRREKHYAERALLNPDTCGHAITYQEAGVQPSDARFVLHRVLPYQNGVQLAMNYCEFDSGGFDDSLNQWRLNVTDFVIHRSGVVRARCVVNAAGIWTDDVNRLVEAASPYAHVLSKGVFLAFPRLAGHESPLIFYTRDGKDCMSLIPWGPVSMWGPTETVTGSPDEARRVHPHEVRFLLDELNHHMQDSIGARDIVSLRVGIRPLVVRRDRTEARDSLRLSRRHRIARDRARPWISVYGGKFTDCLPLARDVRQTIARTIGSPAVQVRHPSRPLPPTQWDEFPTLGEPVPNVQWCAENEMCWSLDDYLRRRTNVSQWIPRGGLGRNDEHMPRLIELAAALHGAGQTAESAAAEYRRNIRESFDAVLTAC